MPSLPHIPYLVVGELLLGKIQLSKSDFVGKVKNFQYIKPKYSPLQAARIRKIINEHSLDPIEDLKLSKPVAEAIGLLPLRPINQDFNNLPMRAKPQFEKDDSKKVARIQLINESMQKMPELIANWKKEREAYRLKKKSKNPF